MFIDRADAGRKLGKALESYMGQDVLVLVIPRGGVEVGLQVAKWLEADFSLIIVRKLPFPDNPESGFGAIAEDGSTYINEMAASRFPEQVVDQVIQRQKDEVERRIDVLREGRALPDIKDRTVILVDDGIAMGSTMRAAIKLCKTKQAQKIVVASPVASARVARQINKLVDRIFILETPPFFHAVAQVYQNWYDVPDHEVLGLMKAWRKEEVEIEEQH